MSENKYFVRNSNTLSQSRAMQNRISSISQRSTLREWTLDSISNKLSASQRETLRETLSKMLSDSNPSMTSAEQLAGWGRTQRSEPYIGDLVLTNTPVVCLGSPVNDRTRDDLISRGLKPDSIVGRERFCAHGLTFGSVFLKMKNKTNSDGSRTVESMSTFTACNNCLDLFMGRIVEGKRETNLWPKDWVNSQANRKPQQKQVRKLGKKNIKRSNSSVLIDTMHSIYGENSDPWKMVTLTMLKAVSKELAVEFSGRKAQQIEQLTSHIASMGDREVSSLLENRLARKARPKRN
jgi:hypothetical protein